ncbi:hypothetical protein Ddye_019455 [Dipteronia dyeriana]|uniref:F-box domain-containing protein n=1 Tax=Dipteronia dyeriana TaxID=168575 RepID=A0AAD9TYS9_9ROSI|nr:hypothetical protein Ddye_019455 [Dipteronia dyeriana]
MPKFQSMSSMEFWCVEIKGGEPLKVEIGCDKILHLAQASLHALKKDHGDVSVSLFLKTGNQVVVLGNLCIGKQHQVFVDLVFEKEIELSHNWKDGSVHFCGYKFYKQLATTNKRPARSLCVKEMLEAGFENKRKKDYVLKAVPFFPNEIIFEILSWLPAEYLLKFKCVCKEWYYLIQDSNFIKVHFSRTPLLMVYDEEKRVGFGISGTIQETFIRVDHISGVILEKGDLSHKYRIRNPITRQILFLPDPCNGTVEVSIYRCQSTYEFKLVSIYRDEKRSSMQGFEIFTIDRDDEWRPLKLPSSQVCRMDLEMLRKTRQAIYYDDGSDDSDLYSDVYCLDVESECFFINVLPQGLFSDSNKVLALDWDGCLAYAEIVEEKLNVIILEDFRKHKWSQRKIIVPLTFFNEIQITEDNFLAPVIFISNKLYFLILEDKLFVYDIQTRQITERKPVSWEDKSLYTTRHSLVTFKGMQPEKIPQGVDLA